MEQSRFESLGVYLPEKIVSTAELIEQMEHKPQFDLEDLTGIKNRRWRSESEDSSSLALTAARTCLEHSQYDVSNLDVIINTSITRFKDGLKYWLEPTMSKFLKSALGLREEALNFDISNACSGMFTGVSILSDMIDSGMVKNGMVVSGECITPITETAIKEITEPIDEQFASLTVGDSGAAVIMDRSKDINEGISFSKYMSLAEHADLCFGMPSVKNSGIAMYTNAMEIHKQVIDRLPVLIKHFVEQNNIVVNDIDYIIPHQTSDRAIKAAFDRCKGDYIGNTIPEILISLNDFGNTSTTSHFVVLHDYIKKGKIKEGSNVLFFILASGIVIGFVLAKIGKLEVN